jgi:hypothetical protein
VGVLQQDRSADLLPAGAEEDPGGVGEPGVEPEPDLRVMVAAGDHDLGAGGRESREGLVGELDGVHRWQRPVVDVSGDHYQVDVLVRDRLEEVVDESSLDRQEPFPVEGAAQVPVGGVEDAHTRTLGGRTDSSPAHTPIRSGAV